MSDFFLWGYVKEKFYVPPLPTNIDEMKDRTTVAINTMDHDVLRCILEEFSYRLDVIHAAGGGKIEHLQHMK